MHIVSFKYKDTTGLGALLGDEVVNLTAMGLPTTLDQLLRLGDNWFEAAKKACKQASNRIPVAEIQWLPPIAYPSKAIAVGLNYVDHATESNFEAPDYPVLFQRYPSSWVAHQEALVRPSVSTQFDYEGELVVVIGKAGHRISKSDALSYVAGYSLFNDGSIRDYQLKSQQWMMGKNFDCSGAFGPTFVTADELPAGAKDLILTTRLNGTVMQQASTNDMIFDIATLVSVCSEAFTLQPGDIIISGTPSGVGMARDPQVFMKAGDTCEIEIEGIGVLQNPVVDE